MERNDRPPGEDLGALLQTFRPPVMQIVTAWTWTRHKVQFFEKGFRFREVSNVNEVRWKEVALLRAIGYGKKLSKIRFRVRLEDRRKFDFDDNTVAGVDRVGALLYEVAQKHSIQWRSDFAKPSD